MGTWQPPPMQSSAGHMNTTGNTLVAPPIGGLGPAYSGVLQVSSMSPPAGGGGGYDSFKSSPHSRFQSGQNAPQMRRQSFNTNIQQPVYGHSAYGGGESTYGGTSSSYGGASFYGSGGSSYGSSSQNSSSFQHNRGVGGGYHNSSNSTYGSSMTSSSSSSTGGSSKLGANLKTPDWSSMTLSHVEKNFYKEAPHVARMTQGEADRARQDRGIKIVTGLEVPNPILTFSDGTFPPEVLQAMEKCGYLQPTPIQVQGWPIGLSGRDLIGIAETGSGKTLAFLLPAVVHILAQPPVKTGDGPIALILAPTRELVEQIKEQACIFAGAAKLKTGVAYGGVSRRDQIIVLKHGLEILLACPGRLLDFLEKNVTNLQRITYLVLDEGDRMLDMGFEPQIRKIVSQIREDRQTLMFSATWPKEVQQLARDLCREDPVHIVIGSDTLKACHAVEQHVNVVSSDAEKKRMLQSLVQSLINPENPAGSPRILIFVETKKAADSLTRELRTNGWPALGIHGDKEQQERSWVLNEFREGTHPIMVATDVASRGLDIKDIRVVVNYDMPMQIQDYVHRIGRTGRAGSQGASYTYFSPDKQRLAKELVEIMEEAKQVVPPELYALARARNGAAGASSAYDPVRRSGPQRSGTAMWGSTGANQIPIRRF